MHRDQVVAVVVGVRPEIIKMAPVVHCLQRRKVRHVVYYTNQHSRAEMSDVFFQMFEYLPDWRILAPFTPGSCLDGLKGSFDRSEITDVIVQGDTTSTLMGALAGMYVGARILHLEAGLRSFDPQMLEERHRRAVDHIAHELLTYTERHSLQLGLESARGRVTKVGNPMVDVSAELAEKIEARAQQLRMQERPFVYVTMHRKEFTDSPGRMRSTFSAIASGAAFLRSDIVYPVHPRTKDCAARAGIEWPFEPCEPVNVIESLARVKHAEVVITDSGGIQEEAAIYGTPCVTIRENTERHETVEAGLNVVTGFDSNTIFEAILEAGKRPRGVGALYGNPGVGERVVDVIVNRG